MWICLSLLFSLNAWSLDLKPHAGPKPKSDSINQMIFETKSDPKKSSGGVTFSVTCTDAMGMTHKKGHPGYDGCLRNQDKLRPDTGVGKRTNSVGITVGK